MKRILLIPTVLCTLLVSSCGQSYQVYTVSIFGDQDEKIQFTGSCLVGKAGTMVSQDISGVTVMQWPIEATSLSCTAQKSDESGTLHMEIARADKSIVGTSVAYQAYGIVSVAGR
jgi:hypothetical protein